MFCKYVDFYVLFHVFIFIFYVLVLFFLFLFLNMECRGSVYVHCTGVCVVVTTKKFL